MCSETEDSFLRPPLWEDITSSIQNIDPENAIMLNALSGVTQVKMEAVDDGFLEPLSSSPLLSPLEIKSEKAHHHQLAVHHNNNNHIHHMHNNNYQVTNYHQQHQQQQSPQPHHNPSHLNGYSGTNGSGSIQMHHTAHIQNNNYYGGSWHHQQPHQQQNQQLQQNNYPPKFSPQSSANLCPPPPMSRLMYVPPLTPPNSDPGSPINGMQGPPRRTPPPPYPPHQQPPTSQHHHITCTPIHIHINTSSLPNHQSMGQPPPPPTSGQHHQHNGNYGAGSGIGAHANVNGGNHSLVLSSASVVKAVQRYNRRNNPELEKRRIHHCDFMGKSFFFYLNVLHTNYTMNLYSSHDQFKAVKIARPHCMSLIIIKYISIWFLSALLTFRLASSFLLQNMF